MSEPATAPAPAHRCDLCGRHVPKDLITLHHLKPKQKGGKPEHRVLMCRPCHKQIHATFTNTELSQRFDTLEALLRAEPLQPFLTWIRKQNPTRNFRTVTVGGERHRR